MDAYPTGSTITHHCVRPRARTRSGANGPCQRLVRALVAAALVVAGSARAQLAGHPGPGLNTRTHAARSRRLLAGRDEPGAAAWLSRARVQHAALAARTAPGQPGGGSPASSLLGAPWSAVGPAQVLTPAYGLVTGRVTALALDPADPSGNTLYVGTTGGGVWKSTNAAGPVAAVTFSPLTDDLPVFNGNAGSAATASLSIGALAATNGVLLAGTGDPNDSTDSLYGSGLLRSTDGGGTWTLAVGSQDGTAGNHSFAGLAFAGLAFSSATPSLAVAAVTDAAEGDLTGARNSASTRGLFFSTDAGVSWHLGTLLDGSAVVSSPAAPSLAGATAVVWNPLRARFFAAIQYHGYYQSADGMTWTRLAHQPGPGLTAANCPATTASTACPIFRGALAVQPSTGDLFALTVDAANNDTGLFEDVCAPSSGACGNASVLFATQLNAAPLESSGTIPQGDYNLALAAVPSGTDTLLFAGTADLYRCTVSAAAGAAGCLFRDTTNAANACTNPAGPAPAQHALLGTGTMLFLGNDGGLWRSDDDVAETGASCNVADAAHFGNLNGGLGSLAEVVAFAQPPADPATLLAGLGALGTAATGTGASVWAQLTTGEGGTVAIDPATPSNWYVSSAAGVSIARCPNGAACSASDFAGTPAIGPAQVADDPALVHAPWLLDPALPTDLLLGTCRVWRGSALGGALWSASSLLSQPFGATGATACSSATPLARALAAGGPASSSSSAQNAGSEVLYAGLAGQNDGGGTLGGHLFTTAAAQLGSGSTAWVDAAASPVTNDLAENYIFNPGGFDVSSVTADPHDSTGRTVYATVMGFSAAGVAVPHLYRSTDGGAHWLDLSANLPDAPANALVVDPNDANTVYVALDTGVYVTTQIGTCSAQNCWSVYGTTLPNAPVTTLAAAAAMPTGDGRNGVLRAGTLGRGIWSIPLLTAVAGATAGITVSPTGLTFPAQQVGTQSTPVPVTVTNSGTAPLLVTSIVTNSTSFLETDGCVGVSVAPGGTCTVQVLFAPASVGSQLAVLTIFGNASGGQATVALAGTGVAGAAVVLTPGSLGFPLTTVGSASAAQDITVSNTGGTAATLTGIAVSGDFSATGNTCGATLAAGTGCTVAIAFLPTASGSRTGTLTVTGSAGSALAALTGTGQSPATDSLAPTSLTFGATALSQPSATQQLTLVNAGDQALTLIAAQVTAGDFTVVNGCGNSLAGHAQCVLTVGFVPHLLGVQTGSLAVSDQFRTQTVALTGTGVAPAGVSLAPVGGLTFAAVAVGGASAAQTVTLTNNGGLPLTLGTVTLTGDFSIAPGTNTCGLSVQPAAACTFAVVFAPAAAGTRVGQLAVTSNGLPQTLALTGVGVDFALTANGATAMTVASGTTATYALLLSSAAGVPGTVLFGCTGAPAHALCSVSPTAPSLGATTPVVVTVSTGVAALHAPPVPWLRAVPPAGWCILLLPLGCVAVRGRRLRGLLFLVLVAVAVPGCSTPRTIPGDGTTTASPPAVTPSGTYTLVVTGTSAGLSRSVTLTLTVQ